MLDRIKVRLRHWILSYITVKTVKMCYWQIFDVKNLVLLNYIHFGFFYHGHVARFFLQLIFSRLFDVYFKFAIYGFDTHLTAFRDVGKQDAQAEGNGEQALDGAAQRAGALNLAKPF